MILRELFPILRSYVIEKSTIFPGLDVEAVGTSILVGGLGCFYPVMSTSKFAWLLFGAGLAIAYAIIHCWVAQKLIFRRHNDILRTNIRRNISRASIMFAGFLGLVLGLSVA